MVVMSDPQTIAVLGASGLIGGAVATDLTARGLPVAAIARRFTSAQKAAFAKAAVETPIASLGVEQLVRLLDATKADILVNCIGVLQDGAHGKAEEVHGAFAARLIAAIRASRRPILLVQISIPGRPDEDATPFSRTKRQAERVIAESGAPFVILRPGFVIAPAAYGGSALIRALSALPFRLPPSAGARPFAATAVVDIAATIAHVAGRWRNGERAWRACWDVMERRPSDVNGVIVAFRRHFGGPRPELTLPMWLLAVGARCADVAGRLGWSPPIRSTALAEMRRGVEGAPEIWMEATGIEPRSLAAALAEIPATIQEQWFARLYMAKALVIATLSAFWIASGVIALTAGFAAAAGMASRLGLPDGFARVFVMTTSLLDILVGGAIAVRRTCRTGLYAALAVSVGYLAGATFLAPELWADPLGPLVKVLPGATLALVALAMLPDR
jgi:uncharacterized protein YbjT (DUF2867 family)